MTTPSTVAVPSNLPQDLLYNAEKLDEALNSSALTYLDRFSVPRLTAAGATAQLAVVNPRGAWVTATAYAPRDVVSNSGTWYIALDSHTSGATFAGDQAAHWRVYQGVTAADLADSADAAKGDALFAVKTAGVARTGHEWAGGQFKNLVADFGALGDDSTDNAATIETAMAWLEANGGGTLFVPAGTYRHSTPIKKRDGIRLIGAGKYDTIFKKTGTGAIALAGASATAANANLVCLATTGADAKMSDGAGNVNCCLWLDASVRAVGGEIAHMTFRGNGTNATASSTRLGVCGIGASEYSIHDVNVEFVSLAAFVMPVYFASTFYNNHAANCGKGFAFEAGTSIAADSNYAIECQWHGFYVRDVSYSSFRNCAVDSLNNVSDATDYTDRSVNSIAYVFNACRLIDFHGGAEQCFGTQLMIDSCAGFDAAISGIGPASSYTGASQVALVYLNALAHGVRLNSVRFERSGVTAIQGSASAANHHDLYVTVASENQGFHIGSWKTCNGKYDAPSAIYGNVVPTYLRPLKQGSKIQGEFSPVLNLVGATGVTIAYGANNKGRFVVDDGWMTVDVGLEVTTCTYTGSPVYPELQGLPFDNASAKNARLIIDQSANVTWASTESYWVDVLTATKIGTIRNRTDAALLTCPAAFASGAASGGAPVYLHITGRVYVGDVLNVV